MCVVDEEQFAVGQPVAALVGLPHWLVRMPIVGFCLCCRFRVLRKRHASNAMAFCQQYFASSISIIIYLYLAAFIYIPGQMAVAIRVMAQPGAGVHNEYI